MEKFIIGAIVNNKFGVLQRVSAMFSRRGYNIESLAVGVTENPARSRMTIVVCGGGDIEEQVVKQLGKLYDVITVDVIPEERAYVSEHMLVKLRSGEETAAEITGVINRFGARVVDFGPETITADVTGDVSNNDRFVEAAMKYGIMEICRAGAQALGRGGLCLSSNMRTRDYIKENDRNGENVL